MTRKFVYDSDTQRVRLVSLGPRVPSAARSPKPRVNPLGSRWFLVAFAIVLSIVGFSVARAIALMHAPAPYSSAR